MLRFIYCGQTENLKDNAVDLLQAADMFQVDSLKGNFYNNKIQG